MFCKLIRFHISTALDSDRDNPAFVQRHISVCPDCRQFNDLSQSITHRLIIDAPDAGRTADFTEVLTPVPIMGKPLVFASALLCLILIGAFVLNSHLQSTGSGDSQWLISGLDQLADTTTGLLPDNPLARELAFVAEDSKGAIESLIACTGLDPESLRVALNDYQARPMTNPQ